MLTPQNFSHSLGEAHVGCPLKLPRMCNHFFHPNQSGHFLAIVNLYFSPRVFPSVFPLPDQLSPVVASRHLLFLSSVLRPKTLLCECYNSTSLCCICSTPCPRNREHFFSLSSPVRATFCSQPFWFLQQTLTFGRHVSQERNLLGCRLFIQTKITADAA